MPDTFIPVLERTGLIMDAGDWVLRKPINAIIRLPLSLAVNVSPRQLHHANLTRGQKVHERPRIVILHR